MKRLLVIAVLLLSGVSTASAAIVTGLSNLLIEGKRYNATIHTSGSFNDIWDKDGDGIFNDNDGSIFNQAPMFWGDQTTAQSATSAVMLALGTTDTWKTNPLNVGTDSIMTPYAKASSLPNGGWYILLYMDLYMSAAQDDVVLSLYKPDTDYTTTFSAYVSYELAPVPLPAAIWLFGTSIIGLIGFSRYKKAA